MNSPIGGIHSCQFTSPGFLSSWMGIFQQADTPNENMASISNIKHSTLSPNSSLSSVIHLLKSLRCLLIVLILPISTGCDTLPAFRQMSPLPPGPICRVAVLPFLNDTKYPLGDAIFQKVFAAEFQASGNYLVVQEGDIHKIYQQLHLLPGATPTPEQLRILANRVKAQLLITGTVVQMQENRVSFAGTDPLIAVDIQIRDGQSGDSMWTTYHRRQGTDYQKVMHFGTIHSIPGLSRQMAVEIINLWQRKGLPQCDVSSQP
jgi:hypothetical protein